MTMTSTLLLLQAEFEAPKPSSSVRQLQTALGGVLALVLMLALIALAPSAVYAQVYGGSLTGVATDPSDAVIPNAHVVLTDDEKGFKYSATTNAEGRYILRNLPPGKYSLAVTAPGMRPHTQSGIILTV